MPRVSIVIPLYNKVRYVTRALDSVYAQDYGDFEIIVVDDGSTDGSRDVVEAYRGRGLKLVSQPNAGPGAARNRGVALAAGELVAFLDADDEWYPFYLSESVRILDECGSGVPAISWNMRIMPGDRTNGRLWDKVGLNGGIFRLSSDTRPEVVVALLATMQAQVTIIRKSAVGRLGGFYSKDKCRYSEDAHLWLKLLMANPVYLHKRDGAIMHVSASELSANHTTVRPIEPFLTDPGDILAACPPEMREILRIVFATRALKTAAVYGYWGHPAQARKLLWEFVRGSDWRLPYFVPALVGCTPVGGWIGAVARGIGRRQAELRRPPGAGSAADGRPRAGARSTGM